MNFLVFAMLFTPFLSFSAVKIEYLSTGSTYNYFSIPSSSINRVDLPDTTKNGAIRVFYEKGYKDWSWTLCTPHWNLIINLFHQKILILIPQVSTTTLSQMSAISLIATALDIDEFAASINQDFIMAAL